MGQGSSYSPCSSIFSRAWRARLSSSSLLGELGTNWLAVGTEGRLSWQSQVEGLPVIRSFLPRKLPKGLKGFITFPQLHWTTWISQGCRFEFFASLYSRVIWGRAVLQFCSECNFPTFWKGMVILLNLKHFFWLFKRFVLNLTWKYIVLWKSNLLELLKWLISNVSASVGDLDWFYWTTYWPFMFLFKRIE